jgi:hypothetical protein
MRSESGIKRRQVMKNTYAEIECRNLGEIVAERIGAKLAKLIVVVVSAAAAMRRTPDEILGRILKVLLVLILRGSARVVRGEMYG